MTHKVIISSITPNGVFPQFYSTFQTKRRANEYAGDFRRLAAIAGVLIRVDHEEALPASRDELKARDAIKREVGR